MTIPVDANPGTQQSMQQATSTLQHSPLQYYKAAVRHQDQIVTLPADAFLGKRYNLSALDSCRSTFIMFACSMPHDDLTVSFWSVGKVCSVETLAIP